MGKRMRFSAVLLCMTLLLTQSVFAEGSAGGGGRGATVILNGEQIVCDVDPEIVNGRTFIPMRAVFEALGMEISWSEQRKEVTAVSGFDEIVLKVGSLVAIHNEDVCELEAAPFIKNGRTMVPVRFIGEAMGYEVVWNQELKRVVLSGEQKTETSKEERTILGAAAELTYNEAIKRAVDNDSNCKTANIKLRASGYNFDRFDNMWGSNLTLTQLHNRKGLELTNNWNEKYVVLSQEMAASNICSDMDEISLKSVDIENLKADLKYAEKKYETDQVRFNSGKISRNELTSSQKNVETARKELEAAETKLEGMYVELYGKLGLNHLLRTSPNMIDSEGKTSAGAESDVLIKILYLEFKNGYAPIGEVDIQRLYNKVVEEDPYIWLVENTEENAQFTIDTFEYAVNGTSYTISSLDLQQAAVNAGGTKANLKNILYSRYNSLLQIEDGIEQLNQSMEELEDTIHNVRALYENGVCSRSDLEEVLQNKKVLNGKKLELMVQHEQTRLYLEKPYLAPSYVVGLTK